MSYLALVGIYNINSGITLEVAIDSTSESSIEDHLRGYVDAFKQQTASIKKKLSKDYSGEDVQIALLELFGKKEFSGDVSDLLSSLKDSYGGEIYMDDSNPRGSLEITFEASEHESPFELVKKMKASPIYQLIEELDLEVPQNPQVYSSGYGEGFFIEVINGQHITPSSTQ